MRQVVCSSFRPQAFLIALGDNTTQLRMTHAYVSSAPSARYARLRALSAVKPLNFRRFKPILGALFSVPAESVVMKIYKAVQERVLYQVTPNWL